MQLPDIMVRRSIKARRADDRSELMKSDELNPWMMAKLKGSCYRAKQGDDQRKNLRYDQSVGVLVVIVLSASRLVVVAAVVGVAVVVLLFCDLLLLLIFWWSRLVPRQILFVSAEVRVFSSSPDPLHRVSSSSRAFSSLLVMPSKLVLPHT